MNVYIRVDASNFVGSGHVMRCLVLADLLKKQVNKIIFICRDHGGNLIKLIEKKGYPVIILAKSTSDNLLGSTVEADAEAVLESIARVDKNTDWLIVDHYSLDYKWEERLRPFFSRIMVVDDLANRKHNCDVLLDQNFYFQQERYKNLVPAHCRQLLGPKYILLRQEFFEIKKRVKEIGEIKRVLVFFGGSDSKNQTMKALEAIQMLQLAEVQYDIVLGAPNIHRDQVSERVKSIPNAKVHVQVNNIAKLMNHSDLILGAGGTNIWERIFLGIPSISIITAENQRQVTMDIDTLGLTRSLGWYETISVHDLYQVLNEILMEKWVDEYLIMSQKCMQFEMADHTYLARTLLQL
jgi:UDP-2,4-diacetamido-2,4,6-trideoxy-beta-L-altropyranose hydrolase